jgi:uncharacterized membrane protein
VQLLELIWVIGASTMIMAALIRLSLRWILAVSVMLVGQNALDGLTIGDFGPIGCRGSCMCWLNQSVTGDTADHHRRLSTVAVGRSHGTPFMRSESPT